MTERAATPSAPMPERRRALESARSAFRRTGAQRAGAAPTLASLHREIQALTEQVRALGCLAFTDSLTGLGNRRSWDQLLSHELARARRSGEPLSVALLDIDDFKEFNDAHGHQAGDRLLVGLAAAWRSKLRDVDVLCRWGGDEFAVLLPDCPLERADAVIGRLAAAAPNGRTCAAGTVCWDGREAEDALLGRADQALYDAKCLRRPGGDGKPAAMPVPAAF
jgi:diguanylate cyclase (GGDEF)-like protein